MKEFVSKLEELIEAEELLFDATPGFGKTYKKFLGQSIAHPAKMNTRLLTYLILNFTKESETVLDPMSGSGSTGVVAALHGRDAVCVELENKFYEWMEEARKKVETQQTLTHKGRIRNVLGDARQLSKLLTEADVVVTSPPYSDAIGQDGGGAVFKGDFQVGKSTLTARRYSRNPKNLGNLRHGKMVDSIITSPPFADTFLGGGDSEKRKERLEKAGHKPEDFLGGKARNVTLKHYPKVDSIITSPPYAESAQESDKSPCVTKPVRKGDVRQSVRKPPINKYSESPQNIGNLRFADVVITSPPYEDAMSSKRHTLNTEKQRKMFREKGWATRYEADVVITSPPYADTCDRKGRKMDNVRGVRGRAFDLPENRENIGNLQKETYLQAMLTVYREMWKVLKPEGKVIIVIKPFIRNKKVVDLPYQTWLLLERAGFKLTRLFKLRLKQQSFWRILYSRKFPDVPKILHEYILVTQKS